MGTPKGERATCGVGEPQEAEKNGKLPDKDREALAPKGVVGCLALFIPP